MTLQMNYQEKYEQGVEQEKIDSAMRMIEDGDLSLERICPGGTSSIPADRPPASRLG